MSNVSNASSPMLPMGVGWVMLCAAGGVGIWLWMRWRREQNKPINRLRRQAQHARQRAYQLREEIPEDATRPAIGLGTALLSLAIVWWQQSQSRSRGEQMRGRARKAAHKGRRQAEQTLSDMDWQERLTQLKDLWSARRVELEKISASRR